MTAQELHLPSEYYSLPQPEIFSFYYQISDIELKWRKSTFMTTYLFSIQIDPATVTHSSEVEKQILILIFIHLKFAAYHTVPS